MVQHRPRFNATQVFVKCFVDLATISFTYLTGRLYPDPHFFTKQLSGGKPLCTPIAITTISLFHHREVILSFKPTTYRSVQTFCNSHSLMKSLNFLLTSISSPRDPSHPPGKIPAILFLLSPSVYESKTFIVNKSLTILLICLPQSLLDPACVQNLNKM